MSYRQPTLAPMPTLYRDSIASMIEAMRNLAKVNRDRAQALANPANYYIKRVVRVVDGDCDWTERATQYALIFEGFPGKAPYELMAFDTADEAAWYLEARCAALGGQSGHAMRTGEYESSVQDILDCVDWCTE